VYDGTPMDSLVELLNKSLTSDGKFYLIIPSERNCKERFLSKMNQYFEYESIELNESLYYDPALEDTQ
jgi:hypothetical protein